MINALNDTGKTVAQIMGDPTAVQAALGESIATQSANSSYRVMAKMAQESLPLIRNAMELVLVGLFPIILLIIILAGTKGGLVLKSYVMMMFWVQLWAPIYAIINYVGSLAAAKTQAASLAGIDGISIDNSSALLNATLSGEAVVGLLCISVPIIALALVKGGEVAATSAVSGMMSPGSSAAQSAGSQVGSGNISAGNVSWGNYSANNSNSNSSNNALRLTDGSSGSVSTEFGTMSGGNSGFVSNQAATSTGLTAGQNTGVMAANTNSSGVTGRSGTGMTAGSNSSLSTGFTKQDLASAHRAISTMLNTDTSSTTGHGFNTGAGTTKTTGNDTSGNFGRTATDNMASRGTLGADINVGSSGKLQPAKVPQGFQDAGGAPGASPGGGVPPANVPQGFQNAGGAPGAAPAGGGTGGAAGAPSAPPSKAQSLVDRVLNTASAGLRAGYGGSVATSEQKSSEAKTSYSEGEKKALEQGFGQRMEALERLAAGTSDQGTKNAIMAIAGDTAKRLDSQYGTNTNAVYEKSASNLNSRTDSAGVNMGLDHGNQAFLTAIAAAGNNPFKAQRWIAQGDPRADAAGRAYASGLASAVVPKGGSTQGLSGEIGAPDKTPEQQFKDGQGAVRAAKARNDSAVQAQSKHNHDQAKQNQFADPNSAPDTKKANEAAAATTAATQEGIADAKKQMAMDGGLNYLSTQQFSGEGGMGSILSRSFAGGHLSDNTPQQKKDILMGAAKLSAANGDLAPMQALEKIGNTRSVTPEQASTIENSINNYKKEQVKQFFNREVPPPELGSGP